MTQGEHFDTQTSAQMTLICIIASTRFNSTTLIKIYYFENYLGIKDLLSFLKDKLNNKHLKSVTRKSKNVALLHADARSFLMDVDVRVCPAITIRLLSYAQNIDIHSLKIGF